MECSILGERANFPQKNGHIVTECDQFQGQAEVGQSEGLVPWGEEGQEFWVSTQTSWSIEEREARGRWSRTRGGHWSVQESTRSVSSGQFRQRVQWLLGSKTSTTVFSECLCVCLCDPCI